MTGRLFFALAAGRIREDRGQKITQNSGRGLLFTVSAMIGFMLHFIWRLLVYLTDLSKMVNTVGLDLAEFVGVVPADRIRCRCLD